LKKLKLTEHSLRQRIQSESKKLAAFSQQTTLLRAETMSMEHMIDEVTDALELSEAAHAKCAAETVSEEDRHNKAVIALEAKIEGKYSVHRKLSQEMQVLRQTALDHQSDLHLAWERTIYAQIANGMTPSKSQKESNIPPVLEFGCVEVKVETETKACEEEAQIIEDLKATLSSFKDQLDEMEERANTSSEKVELEQGAINNARKTEESRRDEASKFLIDIVTLRRENEHVRASFDTLRSLRDDQNAGIKRSIDTVRQENGQAEHNRSLAQHRLSKVATEVRSTSASALREKEAIALKLAEFESEISTVHQCNLSAKEELNRLSSIIESQDKLSRNSLGLSQSAAKKNIAEILNGKLCRTPEEKLKDTRNISRNHILASEYPDLESVRFGYDPKKTLDEQADESLKLIVAHCKHRLNSAKKMQAGLREAAKLEDLELREMQKAAAIESKRKFKFAVK
jgi:chromosome segregation ATPase